MSDSWSTEREDFLGHLIRTGQPEQIARILYPHVRRIATRVLGGRDPDLIDTAAGDAVFAVCRHRFAFRGHSMASTWVHTITRRAALRCARRESTRTAWLVSWDEETEQGRLKDGCAVVPHPLSSYEAIETLREAVPNPDWQRIWLLRNDPGAGRSHEEIALLTGYTPGSVGAILSRVRARINTVRPRRAS